MFPLLLLVTVSTKNLYSQSYPGKRLVSCQQKNISFPDLFRIIYAQTRMEVFYNEEQLSLHERLTVNFQNEPLDNVLALLIKKRGLSWCYKDETLIISSPKRVNPDEDRLPEGKRRTVTGFIKNEKHEPLDTVSITVKGSHKGTTTNKDGKFLLRDIECEAKLLVSRSGYKSMELATYADSILIQLVPMITPLREVNVNGVMQSTLTGSISSITENDINDQPIANVLSALQGRIPGLYINQTTGLPGGGYKIRLRGRNSIQSVSTPLILIDGFPYPSVSFNENFLNIAGSGFVQGATVAASPLNLLNVNDIASVNILKDADATAIYGNKGVNGIILINRKMPGGKKGFNVNVYTGIGKATKLIRYLDTRQYLQMRREGIKNDGREPADQDYDLKAWDTTRYTDWQKTLIGGTARINEGSMDLNLGNTTTLYRLSGLFRKESTVYPSNEFEYRKNGGSIQVNTKAIHQKLKLAFSVNYVADQNLLPETDLTTLSSLPPNTPPVYTDSKTLNFADGTFSKNPFAYLLRTYKAQSKNLGAYMKLNYEITKDLEFRVNAGYGLMKSNAIQANPSKGLYQSGGFSYFFDNQYRNISLDIQGAWKKSFGEEQLSLLLGKRFQKDEQQQESEMGFYGNDAFLECRDSANPLSKLGVVDTSYRYQSLYGHFEYKHANKYLLTLTISRDRSSRLSPSYRDRTFGALGAAWVFSREKWLSGNSFISYGKIRGSLGFTGNDQYTSDFNNDTYLPPFILQKKIPGTNGRNYATFYSWEKLRKAELAVELGFMNERVTTTLCYYNNRSTDQLLSLKQYETLESDIYAGRRRIRYTPVNSPAIVENSGLEIDVTSVPVNTGKITWNSTFNFSLPQNKLVSFPDIAQTNYKYLYSLGMQLDMVQSYHFLEVDPSSGLYKFESGGKDIPSKFEDLKYGQQLAPTFYGGLQNTFRIKAFEIDFLIRFAKQNNYDYVFASGAPSPGTDINQALFVWDRWQRTGDQAAVQKFTADMETEAGQLFSAALFSDRRITDASYVRLQSFSFAYYLSNKKLERIKMKNCKLYLQGVNLFTLTNYKGRDPEMTTSVEAYPPLRILTAGIQLSF